MAIALLSGGVKDVGRQARAPAPDGPFRVPNLGGASVGGSGRPGEEGARVRRPRRERAAELRAGGVAQREHLGEVAGAGAVVAQGQGRVVGGLEPREPGR